MPTSATLANPLRHITIAPRAAVPSPVHITSIELNIRHSRHMNINVHSLSTKRLFPFDDDANALYPHKDDSDESIVLQTLHFPSTHSDKHKDQDHLQLTLSTDVGPGCGGRAWPAGMVLADYLLYGNILRNGSSILELGSGTGLVGLVAGLILSKSVPSATILISDRMPMMDLMKKNIALNNLETFVKALQLDWGDELPNEVIQNPPQLILVADCIYFEPAFPLLIQTLRDLTQYGAPEILFCYKKRRKADRRFFLLLKKDFDWVEVEDHPDKESYKQEAISLMRVIRRFPKLTRNRKQGNTLGKN